MLILADTIETLMQPPTGMFLIGGIIAVVAIVSGAVKGIAVSRAREHTRREIAAYVAEGSIDPDKAVEMIKAGTRSSAP